MNCKWLLSLILAVGVYSAGTTPASQRAAGPGRTTGMPFTGVSGQSAAPHQAPAGREEEKPLSISEIISMLERSGAGKMSQGDIAAQVFKRGISFTPTEAAIQQLSQAGAQLFLLDTIQRAGEPQGPPKLMVRTSDADPNPTSSDQETEEEARQRARAEMLARMPLIEQARYKALDFAGELPNFIVTQAVTRSTRQPNARDWRVQDRLEVQLTFRADKGEEYKLISVDGKPARQSYDQLGGSTSAGEFGSFLASLFAPPSKARFREIKHETFRNRDAVIYDYYVAKVNSTISITDKVSGRTITAGYKGSLWIDPETKQVLRVEAQDVEIPPDFPINMAENSVEYDWVTIAGERYLLPAEAQVLMGRDRDRYYMKNVIEFRNYHKYEGDVKLIPDSK
jgi:hypothetical protein